MYLLDSNIVLALAREPYGDLGKRIESIGDSNVAINCIIEGEVRFGVEKRRSAELRRRVELILDRMKVLEIGVGVGRAYADIRAALERAGTPIGANDLWIAAHARAEGMTLVTANEREFARVAGLKIENWLA